jgi:hypothetical protein
MKKQTEKAVRGEQRLISPRTLFIITREAAIGKTHERKYFMDLAGNRNKMATNVGLFRRFQMAGQSVTCP